MEKIWLASYPPGVPSEIDEPAGSPVDLFEGAVARYRDRVAFRNLGTSLTFDELDVLSGAFAAFLRVRLGLEKGARVALMMPNLLQYPVALFGVLRAGLVVVNTNPLYTARELGAQLADSGAEAVVILDCFAHVLERCLADTRVAHVVVTRTGDLLGAPRRWLVDAVVRHVKRRVRPYRLPGAIGFRAALAEGRRLELARVALTPPDLAFLQYTGGTTGIAKAAMLTHGNLVANVAQARTWIAAWVVPGEEVVVTALPLYHVFALTANCLLFLTLGGVNHLVTDPRDMRGFVRGLRGVRFTAITGVNTLFNGLLHAPGFAALDFSSLRISLSGGMSLQRAVAERWRAVTGNAIVEAYGLTETSPAVCINRCDVADYDGSVGLPLPSTECSVRDDAGRELGVGEAGELWVRGPQVMAGYWGRPDETAACIDAGGWLRTGDVATIDAGGYVRIVDRKKDMIIVSGFKVYPNEVEDVVAAHPGVLEAGAIGIPDAASGEAVKLVVVRRDPALTREALEDWCRRYFTGYKRPKSVEFADSLPKSNDGKILRRELRERFGAPSEPSG